MTQAGMRTHALHVPLRDFGPDKHRRSAPSQQFIMGTPNLHARAAVPEHPASGEATGCCQRGGQPRAGMRPGRAAVGYPAIWGCATGLRFSHFLSRKAPFS